MAVAEAGCDVGITWHRDEARAESLLEELADSGQRIEAVHLDLHDLAPDRRRAPSCGTASAGSTCW